MSLSATLSDYGEAECGATLYVDGQPRPELARINQPGFGVATSWATPPFLTDAVGVHAVRITADVPRTFSSTPAGGRVEFQAILDSGAVCEDAVDVQTCQLQCELTDQAIVVGTNNGSVLKDARITNLSGLSCTVAVAVNSTGPYAPTIVTVAAPQVTLRPNEVRDVAVTVEYADDADVRGSADLELVLSGDGSCTSGDATAKICPIPSGESTVQLRSAVLSPELDGIVDMNGSGFVSEDEFALGGMVVPQWESATIPKFEFSLLPVNANWTGRVVTEVLTPGANSCTYRGAVHKDAPAATWIVGDANIDGVLDAMEASIPTARAGIDSIGFPSTMVYDLRRMAPVPCTNVVSQTMVIDCPGLGAGTAPYAQAGTLTRTVNPADVKSTRNGVEATIPWDPDWDGQADLVFAQSCVPPPLNSNPAKPCPYKDCYERPFNSPDPLVDPEWVFAADTCADCRTVDWLLGEWQQYACLACTDVCFNGQDENNDGKTF